MNSRDSILAAVKANQPALKPLPLIDYRGMADTCDDLSLAFELHLQAGGGTVYRLANMEALRTFIQNKKKRIRFKS